MKKYTGTKTIKARPMTLGAYNHHRGWTIPEEENPADEGYLVGYPGPHGIFDGSLEARCCHISWSPKDVFEASYSIAETFLDRLIIEKEELDKKTDALVAFLEEKSDLMSLWELEPINEQYKVMEMYLDILDRRIARAERLKKRRRYGVKY